MNKFGKLAPVNLRDYWHDEAQHFTPWLSQPDNLLLLGETLGLSLEPEGIEVGVGRYKADIIATLAGSSDMVVIENQLEQTDHSHLGQALTYAARLGATTVIWIAKQFTTEHRDAINWLNNLATTNLQLFGVEIRLWQIGDSLPAPQFVVVAQPDEAARVRRDEKNPELRGAPRLYMEFWNAFSEYVVERGNPIRLSKPGSHNGLSIRIGRSGFGVNAVLSAAKGYVGCELYLSGPAANQAYIQLEDQKSEIEAALGELDWQPLPEGTDCRIAQYRKGIDLKDQDGWSEHFEWLEGRCKAFVDTFAPRVRELNLTSQPLEADIEEVLESESTLGENLKE